ncbi:heavy metal translocating P-type ATPase [Shewanella fidelis]|uniref:P-type Cu(2+) transporter n=1 Tax=Shewanella fidelis TaxID=173509 RepID=A0AAW8NKT3_9GAMM|nr:heavy metal translocating P-type ATPase metal-binding domain-containing protein [Shewanella fidelis]MDR8523868.1 heavy metal translocating P-type ATPase metal-binding domain-containing protein [Shewanella fidelis]MDW4810415.1 heavy metal translocating P-type ATPase metal-binding domain-containing protein [Shewanella fidelis]MDW4814536.1 heavy metal translocating P-type ATPase metal-binding domain-containing protein [Shewanella fidelis]MDW4818626.1 heavy metal translocating P-type ATPase meta
MSQANCFHCNEPVLTGQQFTTRINDVEQLMCCPGCQAVSQAIIDAGLTNYYKFRTEPGNKQTALVPEELSNFSAYDLPEVQQDFIQLRDALSEVSLTVDGITCAACAWLIEHKIKKLNGVAKIQVNSTTQRALIAWDSEKIKLSEILNQISLIGYQAAPFQVDEQETKSKKDSRKFLLRLGLAGFATMQVMMFALALYSGYFTDLDLEYRDYFRWVSMLFAAPVVFYSAQPFYFSAVRSMLMGRLNMDVSVSIAICGAYIASCIETINGTGEVYFESVSMFTFFLLLGRFFEQNARQKASVSSSNLHKLVPLTAQLQTNDGFEEVPAKRLAIGDVILVKPGEVIAADGVVVEGVSAVNEAMLTGEQMPLAKELDAQVFAGTINIEQPILVKVTALGQDQLVAEIIRLQEIASNNKPKIALYADRFSNYFTAAILLIATLTYLFWYFYSPEDAFWITLSVLVATCPCALALATPTAVTCGTAIMTRLGIITRRSGVFERLPKIEHVVFDKTGTLTLGSLSITDIELTGELTKQQALTYIAALEAGSLHPIAKAFSPYFNKSYHVSERQSVVGKGLTGYINGQFCKLGSQQFVNQSNDTETSTVVWLSCDDVVQAKISLNDEVRPETEFAVQQLKRLGCKLSIASGDNSTEVVALGKRLGISDTHQGLSPQGKLQLIDRFQQQGQVAMFGDGINDAPVLAGANLSVAMGSGAAISKNSADIILLGDNLSRFADAVKVAKLTGRIIKQNLFWALGYNLFIIPLAVTGHVAPYIAAIGMSASSLIVVSNSLRLLKVRL